MLHNLIQDKTKLMDKMTQLWKIREEGKTFTREQESEYDKMSTQVKALNKTIRDRQEYLEYMRSSESKDESKFKFQMRSVGILDLMKTLVARREGSQLPGCDIGKVNEFVRNYEMESGIQTPVEGISIPPACFRETTKERAKTFKRALTTADASGGEALDDFLETPTLDVLYDKTCLVKVGAKVRELASVGNYKVVKYVDGTNPESLAEGATATPAEVSISEQFDLEPKRVSKVIIISNLWLKQSKDSGVVERGLLKSFGSHIDRLSLNGTGSANQPTGILKDTSLLSVDVSSSANTGAQLTWENIQKAEEQLLLKNADSMGTAYITNPKVRRKSATILRASASNADFLYNTKTERLADKPTAITNLIPSNTAKGTSTANLSQIFLTTPENICLVAWTALGGVLSISTEGQAYFLADQSAFKIQNYFNVALERPDSSHCLIKNIITEA